MEKISRLALIVGTILLLTTVLGHLQSWVLGVNHGAKLMLWADQTIINATILVMIAALFRPRLDLAWIPLLIFFGEILYDQKIFLDGLHPVLLSIDLYREALGRHATGVVNPQFAMLLVYFLCWAALAIVCVRRAYRSFDRVIVLVAATSVAATFVLFHGLMMTGISRLAISEGRVIAAALKSDEPSFKNICASLRLECSTHAAGEVASGNLASIDPLATNTVQDLARQGRVLTEPYVWDGATDDDASKTTFFIIGVATTDEGYRIARSRTNFEEETKFEEFRYTLPALVAHATWMALSLLLIAIHRRHTRGTVRKLFSAQSFS